MPDVFRRKAYEAVANGNSKLIRRLRPKHFETNEGINEALGWLGPDARCDAVYADWIEALNSPESTTLLRVRHLLIEQGGLAANYLAEFAQNADDAYPGEFGGEVRIWTKPGWLLVANNGRRINGTDLLGLCRFFANGSKIESSTDELIGRFGIGFKSCYRIGTEVWVHTWEETHEEFSFRIPLCKVGRPQSHYDQATFERIKTLLGREQSRATQDELGYCTPEHNVSWPTEIAQDAHAAREATPRHGTVFAIRLHEEGVKVLKSRLQDQRDQIFELCPLFVRRLRVTRLEDTALRLIVHNHDIAWDIPDVVAASQVTLEAQTGSDARSNARFWRLAATGEGQRWKLALHADSNFQLNVGKETGETTSLREGAAYAFFPLTIPWPFKLHLHLDHPTNLDRSNWNPEQPELVEHSLGAAAAGLGQWLETHHDRWHESWSLSQIIEEKPRAPLAGQGIQYPAHWFYTALKQQVFERRLLRTVWGGFTTGTGARYLRVRNEGHFLQAWREMTVLRPDLREEYGWCLAQECAAWDIREIAVAEVHAQAARWIATMAPEKRPAFSRHLLLALLSLESSATQDWERALGLITVDQQGTKLTTVFARPGGSTLEADWHTLFAQLRALTRHEYWAEVTVGRNSLYGHFERLSKPALNPDWEIVPSVMHSRLSAAKWDEFFTAEKDRCPESLADGVIRALLVRGGSEVMQPLGETWLFGRTPPNAFKRLFKQVLPPKLPEYCEKLQKWGLWEHYLASVKGTLNDRLPGLVKDDLAGEIEKDSLGLWLEAYDRDLQELARVGAEWKVLHADVIEGALGTHVSATLAGSKGKALLSRSIDPDLRTVLCWLPAFTDAPTWLDDRTEKKMRDLRLGHLLDHVEFIYSGDIRGQAGDLVRKLVEIAWTWAGRNPSTACYAAINQLAGEMTALERKLLPIGVSQRKRTSLADFIVPENLEEDPNLYWLHKTRGFSDKLMPAHLARIPALREVCPQATALKVVVKNLPVDPISYPLSALQEDIKDLPPISKLLASDCVHQVYHLNPIEIEWWDGEHCVATHDKADFVFTEARLYVRRVVSELEDHQIEIILGNYLQYAAHDPEVDDTWKDARRRNVPLVQVYTKYRSKIRQTLLSELVTKMGYEPSYIWRELLQNAENAYISMPTPQPEDCSFEMDAVQLLDGKLQVRVTNRGRRFNQNDHAGNKRSDIDRIISAGGDRVQISEEIGRFNLGFKSLFSTTDTVSVTSGGYAFEIRDLLMLYPASPVLDDTKSDRPTVFEWQCSKEDFSLITGIPIRSSRLPFSPFLSAPYVIFGQAVNRLKLSYRERVDETKVARITKNGVDHVTITLPDNKTDNYRILHDECGFGRALQKYRYSCAIRFDAAGLPVSVNDSDRRFHLRYPTDEKAFTRFLLDAEFEPAGVDRRQLIKSRRNLALVTAGMRKVLEYALADLNQRFSRELWLAWADVLDPKSFAEGIRSSFDEGTADAERLADEIKRSLLGCVPHGESRVESESLRVPTRLLRKFAAQHGDEFEIDQDDWIDEKIEKKAEQLGFEPNHRLNEWVAQLPQELFLLNRVRDALNHFNDFSQVESHEMEKSRAAVGQRLDPIVRAPQDWDLSRLIRWWRENLDEEPYVLEGPIFPLICAAPGASQYRDRKQYLRENLQNPTSPVGMAIWYRMFTYACLISAGHRTSEIQSFLTRLGATGFFDRTTAPDADFSQATVAIFDTLVQREHVNQRAAGEDAHFWRRVFYDVRKVHHLIYQNEFPTVFLELCQIEEFGTALPDFLRSGAIPGQRRWRGVLGQSAAGPILFVTRELRRLGVIRNATADPVSFFPCRPVRRVAARLGWIDPALEEAPTWEELLEISADLHQLFTSTDEARLYLLPYYDIPLLALDQTGLLNQR